MHFSGSPFNHSSVPSFQSGFAANKFEAQGQSFASNRSRLSPSKMIGGRAISLKSRTSSSPKISSSFLAFEDKLHDSPDVKSMDSNDEEDILRKCSELSETVEYLKGQKYNEAVQEYRAKCEGDCEAEFMAQRVEIDRSYDRDIQKVRQELLGGRLKIAKAGEEIQKYRQVYQMILAELQESRGAIEENYTQNKRRAEQFRDSLLQKWRVQESVDQLMKRVTLS